MNKIWDLFKPHDKDKESEDNKGNERKRGTSNEHMATLGTNCIKKHKHSTAEEAFNCNNSSFGVGNWIYECNCGEETHYHNGLHEATWCAKTFQNRSKKNPIDLAKARSLDDEMQKEAKMIASGEIKITKCALQHDHGSKAQAESCDQYHADLKDSDDIHHSESNSKADAKGHFSKPTEKKLAKSDRHRTQTDEKQHAGHACLNPGEGSSPNGNVKKQIATLGLKCLQMHHHLKQEDAFRCNNTNVGVGNWLYECNSAKETHFHSDIKEAQQCGTTSQNRKKEFKPNEKMKKHIATLGLKCLKGHKHSAEEDAFKCNNKSYGVGNWIYECNCGEVTHYHQGIEEARQCGQKFHSGSTNDAKSQKKTKTSDASEQRPAWCAFHHQHATEAEAKRCNEYNAHQRKEQREKEEYFAANRPAPACNGQENRQENSNATGPIITLVDSDEETK